MIPRTDWYHKANREKSQKGRLSREGGQRGFLIPNRETLSGNPGRYLIIEFLTEEF